MSTPRAGCKYVFVPVMMDRTDARTGTVSEGTVVRVVPGSGLGVSGRLPSRFAYIELLDGTVIGMCCSASLVPLAKYKDFSSRNMKLRKCVTPDCKNTGEVFAGGLQGGLCSECMKPGPNSNARSTR